VDIIKNIRKPRCFLVTAEAPQQGVSPAEANRILNGVVDDRTLPLVIFHDHFIGTRGGIAIFFAETAEEREALMKIPALLEGWKVDVRPLIFSYNPAAFDEQIAYTLRAYRDKDWSKLREDKRPAYGIPREEAENASE
jgi:hypothetical protein